MKLNWNKKYTTYAIYAAIVSAAVIFCIFVGVYARDVWKAILKAVDIFSPLFYGVIIAYILNPLLSFFERTVLSKIKHKMLRRGLGVTLTYLVFMAVFSLLIYAVVPQLGRSFSDLQANLAVYSQSLQEWLNNVSEQSGFFAEMINKLTEFVDFSVLTAPIEKLIQIAYDLVREFSPHIMGFFGSFIVQLANIIIGLIFAGYLLCSKELLFAQINKLMHVFFKKERVAEIKRSVSFADKTFGKYIMGTIIDAIIVGCLTAVAMLIFGIARPYIPLIAVIIACTNIIPIFGPFIGGIPSAFIIFIANPLDALWFVIAIFVIQQIDANFIAPRVLGSSTGLPALYVIIAITVMGGFFGVGGMIVGVPIFAIIGKIITDGTDRRIKAKKAEIAKSGDFSQDGYTDEDYEGYDEFEVISDPAYDKIMLSEREELSEDERAADLEVEKK